MIISDCLANNHIEFYIKESNSNFPIHFQRSQGTDMLLCKLSIKHHSYCVDKHNINSKLKKIQEGYILLTILHLNRYAGELVYLVK